MNYNLKILDIFCYSIEYTRGYPFWEIELFHDKERRNSELACKIIQYIEKPEHKDKVFSFGFTEREKQVEVVGEQHPVWIYSRRVAIYQVLNS